MLAGVAGGVAETLDADPSLVRIAWALLAILTGGIAIVVYIVMAIVVPEGPTAPWPPGVPASPPVGDRAEWRASRRAARRARRGGTLGSGDAGLIFGVVLILIGALFLARQAIPWFDFHVWWPIGLIGLGVLLLLAAMRPRPPIE